MTAPSSVAPNGLAFWTPDGRLIVTFTNAGRFERGPDFPDDDEASVAFVEALERLVPQIWQSVAAERDALQQELNVAHQQVGFLMAAYKARGLM